MCQIVRGINLYYPRKLEEWQDRQARFTAAFPDHRKAASTIHSRFFNPSFLIIIHIFNYRNEDGTSRFFDEIPIVWYLGLSELYVYNCLTHVVMLCVVRFTLAKGAQSQNGYVCTRSFPNAVQMQKTLVGYIERKTMLN